MADRERPARYCSDRDILVGAWADAWPDNRHGPMDVVEHAATHRAFTNHHRIRASRLAAHNRNRASADLVAR